MNKLFILPFAICFIMCTPKPQICDEIFVDFDRPEKVSLFEYFRSIELIPLETSSDVLVQGITKVVFHQDKYYTLDKPQCLIFVFDKTGKFLFKIGTKGQGAGEYAFIEDFNINPFSGNIEILEPYGRIHIYDVSGSFIETKRIAYPGFKVAHSLAAIGTSTYVSQSVFEPKKSSISILISNSYCMKNLRKIWKLVATHMILSYIRTIGFFFDLFIPSFIKWGKSDLKLLINLTLENILKMVELPFSRKSQKDVLLKEQKKCLINFRI